LKALRFLVCAAALGAAFYQPVWGWGIIASACTLLLVILLTFKRRSAPHAPEISERANRVLQKHTHVFEAPLASKFYAGTATWVQLTGLIVALVGLSRGFWWGLLLFAGVYVLLRFVARSFIPPSLCQGGSEAEERDEIWEMLARYSPDIEAT